MNRTRVRLVGIAALVVVVVVALFANPLQVGGPRERPAQKGPSDVKLVTVDPDSDARLWPYTSKRRRFNTLTLPINVAVRGNAWRVRSLLVEGEDAEWNRSSGTWQGVGDEMGHRSKSERRWYESHGATRYTYVQSPDADQAGWLDETYQLHDGDYFGTRYHLRAYAGGEEPSSWTAIQAHHEHWDWFRLRHTVGSTAAGRRYVEREFFGRRAVEDVHRDRFANGGISDADGWASVPVLTDHRSPSRDQDPAGQALESVALLLVGASTATLGRRLRAISDEIDPRLVAVAVGAVGLLPGVRWAAITAEHAVPTLSPKPVAATGYLVIALGLPTCAYLAGRIAPPGLAVLVTVGGVGTGVFLDYAIAGVTVVPVSVLTHRAALLGVLGVVAASTAPRAREAVGRRWRIATVAVLWLGILVWPIADVL